MYPTSIDGKPSAGGFRMPHHTVRVFRTGFSRSDREFEEALTPCRETSVFRQGEASHQPCAIAHATLPSSQKVLARPRLQQAMTPRDYAALTPLIWSHVNPYGRFDLDMNARMALA